MWKWIAATMGLGYLLARPSYVARAAAMVPSRDRATIARVVHAAGAASRRNRLATMPWVLAVAYTESRFNPAATSSVACGAWQQIPRYSARWADDGQVLTCEELCTDVPQSARVASRQLEHLFQRYGIEPGLRRYHRGGGAWDDAQGAEYYRRVRAAYDVITAG